VIGVDGMKLRVEPVVPTPEGIIKEIPTRNTGKERCE
jgi:hypothetical protein